MARSGLDWAGTKADLQPLAFQRSMVEPPGLGSGLTLPPRSGDGGEAPGWEAIERALVEHHGDQEPVHVASMAPDLAEDGGLSGISAYRCDDPPHWHLISFGMSELYGKEGPDPTISGWGFELTMRVERSDGDGAPPPWAFDLLQNLARYVEGSGSWFEPGHHMDLNGPIASGADVAVETELTAVLFDEDPSLGNIDTPNGQVQFLQVLGVTGDERQAALSWQSRSFVELLTTVDEHRIVALARRSILDDPAIQSEVSAGLARDGSSCELLAGGSLEWSGRRTTVLSIGALVVRSLLSVLPGRIPFGRSLELASDDGSLLVFEPGPIDVVKAKRKRLLVQLTEPGCRALVRAIEPSRGRYSIAAVPGLVVEVEPTEVRNQAGDVVDVVG